MAAFMKPFVPQTYAVLRIVTGLLFLWHGASKLFGFPVPAPGEAPPFVIYVAGPIELVGGALVMVGLFTRWAAFLCSGTMAVAYFMGHWIRTGDFFPILNKGELAVVYCWVFLLIAARGSGTWSVDAARSRE